MLKLPCGVTAPFFPLLLLWKIKEQYTLIFQEK